MLYNDITKFHLIAPSNCLCDNDCLVTIINHKKKNLNCYLYNINKLNIFVLKFQKYFVTCQQK